MTRILIVDDSPVDQLMASTLLEKHSKGTFHVRYVNDGSDVAAEIAREAPDLVITDLQMPVMDGLALVAMMKDKYPQIPVILMTAAGSEEIAVKALQAGAASYVPKKKLAKELWETVSKVLEVAREQRAQANVLKHQLRWECEFDVENDLELIMGMAGHIMQGLRSMSIVDPAEEVRMGVALAEALLNAYYHGNLEVPDAVREKSAEEFADFVRLRRLQSPYRDRRLHVSARFSRGMAIFSVRDEGTGFDTSDLPNPSDPRTLEHTQGRGLFLIRSFMDEVRFKAPGNTITMIKNATK